jgi:hypothetical protein
MACFSFKAESTENPLATKLMTKLLANGFERQECENFQTAEPRAALFR